MSFKIFLRNLCMDEVIDYLIFCGIKKSILGIMDIEMSSEG